MNDSFVIAPNEARSDILMAAAALAERVGSADGRADAVAAVNERLLARKEVDVAAQLADTLPDDLARDRQLIAVAARCAEIDDDEYAEQLVEAVEDFSQRAIAHERLAEVKAAKGDFQQALKLAGSLDHAEHVFSVLAARYAAEGLTREADEMLSRIEYPPLRVRTLCEMAARNIDKKEFPAAIERLEAATEVVKDIDLPEEALRELNAIAHFFIAALRKDHALETLNKAKAIAEPMDSAWREVWLAQIAIRFAEAESMELAERALDLVRDKTHFASALAAIAELRNKRGDAETAREDLEEAYAVLKSQTIKDIRDSESRYGVLATVATRMAGLGAFERAHEMAAAIDYENSRWAAHTGIAALAAREDMTSTVVESLKAIDPGPIKVSALLTVSDVYRQKEEKDKSLEHLSNALDLCEEVPQLPARADGLNKAARRFHSLGDADKAREILRDNLSKTVASILDQSAKAKALVDIATSYDDLGLEISEEERAALAKIVAVS